MSALDSIASPTLWAVTVGAVLLLLAVDFALTRRPHDPSMKEAVGWSVFYLALPMLFGIYVVTEFGGERGLEYYTGYLVEKSLSVDNLFVFILLLAGFAVPRELRQRVLLYGIIGALVMRTIFILLGAAALNAFDWVFLVFGLVLIVTAARILRDAVSDEDHEKDVDEMRTVRLVRRVLPVTGDYEGTKILTRENGKRAVTPLALVTGAVLATDLVFAIDSVPAVYGITGDPYLVFATNAFALLGLRALYFVLEGVLGKLVHLGYGLAAILAFIGVKLSLHWAHEVWPGVPTIPTLASLVVVVGILALTTVTSLLASRQGDDAEARDTAEARDEEPDPVG